VSPAITDLFDVRGHPSDGGPALPRWLAVEVVVEGGGAWATLADAGWFPVKLRRCPCGACYAVGDSVRHHDDPGVCRACDREMPGDARRESRRRAPDLRPACQRCGAEMLARRPTRRFCSVRCRVAQHRASKSA